MRSGVLVLGLALALPGPSAARQVGGSWAPCPAGRIAEVVVDAREVFEPDSADASLVRLAFRAANLLHMRTAEGFIREELLFAEGDCLDPSLLAETERLLESYGFLVHSRVTSSEGPEGHVVRVETRDDWTTKVDVGLTWEDGPNLEKLTVNEENFFGRGVAASFRFRERREERLHGFSLSTPRLFGRTNGSIAFGTTRAGSFLRQSIAYPFVGETGVHAGGARYARTTDYFRWSTDGAESFTDVLTAVRHELVALWVARRFGEPSASTLIGVTLSSESFRHPGPPELLLDGDLDDPEPADVPLPGALHRQVRDVSVARVVLHLATRRFNHGSWTGLDAVRERTTVALGYFAGISAGRAVGVGVPGGGRRLDDAIVRTHVLFTAPLGTASLLHGVSTAEARRESGEWQDLLAEADLVAYLRSGRLPGQTLFLRTSVAAGWRTRLPYQLTLGGREGVRSLEEGRLPGGRQLLLTAEDRVRLPWIPWGAADLGATAFVDAGRTWRGDAPWGRDSGWQGAVGVGLRVASPSGSRNVYRADLAFPVGSGGGSPIFRITLETNRIRNGFSTPELGRSRRLPSGLEGF